MILPNKNIITDYTITKEEIDQLPIERFNGNIIIIDNLEKVDSAVEEISKCDIVGFDTETKPSFQKGISNKISLIQISKDESCFLFRLNLIGFPKGLSEIISNSKIKKIGLSLRDDFSAIKKTYNNNSPYNFIDLQLFVDKFGILDNSLQKMYALLFSKKISKKQRLSNWDAKDLTNAQKEYAALDAWACLRIYNFFTNKTNE